MIKPDLWRFHREYCYSVLSGRGATVVNHRIREGVMAKQPICADVSPRREPNEVKLKMYTTQIHLRIIS